MYVSGAITVFGKRFDELYLLKRKRKNVDATTGYSGIISHIGI